MRNGWQLKQIFAPKTRLAGVLALLGACVYAIQSYIYAFRLTSMLDEGAYLYKGYLFVSGLYRPFQDFGPWTNKAPLAFLIPGYFPKPVWAGFALCSFCGCGHQPAGIAGTVADSALFFPGWVADFRIGECGTRVEPATLLGDLKDRARENALIILGREFRDL